MKSAWSLIIASRLNLGEILQNRSHDTRLSWAAFCAANKKYPLDLVWEVLAVLLIGLEEYTQERCQLARQNKGSGNTVSLRLLSFFCDCVHNSHMRIWRLHDHNEQML